VGLPHRDREPGRPAAVQLAETRVAVALGMVLIPLSQGDLNMVLCYG
jgi:hypothetical protein